MNTIKINDRFEFYRDPNCWVLVEHTYGERFDKDKGCNVPFHGRSKTFYSALQHLCGAVIDRSAGEACDGMESVIECIKRAENDLHVAICGGE